MPNVSAAPKQSDNTQEHSSLLGKAARSAPVGSHGSRGLGLGAGHLEASEWFAKSGYKAAATDNAEEASETHKRNSPEENAGWLSQIWFLYCDPLIQLGAQKHLEQTDLWDVAKADEAHRVSKSFNTTLQGTVTKDRPHGVVWKAILRAHGPLFLWTGFVKLIHDLIMFLPPFLLELLLSHVASGGSKGGSFLLALALLGTAVLENVTVNLYFHQLYRMSLHLKIQMIAMIYEKSLRVSNAVKSEMGVGAIVNLQSNDASKIWNTPLYMHIIWNGPFQIFIVMAMLVRIMGWAPAMAGLAVTIVMIPLSTLVGRALGTARRAMIKQTDGRVKLATEIITGIKAIKLYAWEDAYMERIAQLRDNELKHIRFTQLLSSLNMATFQSGPVLVALAAFGVYTAMGASLTAAIAFPALSLFNLLRFPIIMFPSQVMNMIHARVGLQRIQKFMQAEEMKGREALSLAPGSDPDNPFSAITVHPAGKGSTAAANGVTNASAVLAGVTKHAVELTPQTGKGQHHKENGTAAEQAQDADDVPLLAMSVDHPALAANGTGTTGDHSSVNGSAGPKQVHGQNGHITAVVTVAANGSEEEEEEEDEIAEEDVAVDMKDATFSWGGKGAPVIKDLCLRVAKGQLVMIVGEVGSGKSSLLHALLGEMHHLKGTARTEGTIAYTSQDPFIMNTTVRKNILMGAEFDQEQYTATLAACALGPDLDVLPAGDATEIGEKGVNLSGGQKHRVALARAAYADADVYLLDDPLSAVDAHVGRHLFDHCIRGLLEGRTRLLVTHQLQYLPSADVVVVMSGGCILEVGSYEDLCDRGVDLNQILKKESEASEAAGGDKTEGGAGTPSKSGARTPVYPKSAGQVLMSSPALIVLDEEGELLNKDRGDGSLASGGESAGPSPLASGRRLSRLKSSRSGRYYLKGEELTRAASMRRMTSIRELTSLRQSLQHALTLRERDGKIIKVEERAVGRVEREIYKAYLSAWSTTFIALPVIVAFMAFGERGLQVLQNFVLSLWSNATEAADAAGGEVHAGRYILLYSMLGLASIGLQLIRAIAMIAGSIAASRTLHNQLMAKVVRLPMSFYDSQPTGRLLNRLTKDTESVDIQLSGSLNMALVCLVNAALSVLVVAVVSPVALVALAPMSWLYYRIQAVYIASSREMKRLDSLAFSPIFQHFNESLQGLTTLRAFGKQGMFMQMNRANLDNSNRAYWPIQVVNRWLSVRLEMMGAFIVFLTATCVTVIMPSNPGLVGLAITSALNLTGIMNWMVRQMTELEVNMNSVERLVEYLKYDEEAPTEVAGTKPPPGWPHAGAIEARNLTVKYRPELEPVLKGLSFSIKGQEKIGVCGRTGCGKSTLMITIYRLIEPCGGTLVIDGVDICTIGLRDLRSRLSLVPQDPVIFSGTIRSNLDPFKQVPSDAAVWEALHRAGMDSFVRGLEGGLDAPIKEGGANLSVGQRQLLCMARALLRASRILVLDEATSNVDNGTDGTIQATIRSAFASCTVLTIAHRLHTIIDSDRILVLEAGQLLEFDTPNTLLQKPQSAFRKLVEETTRGGGLNAGVVAGALAAATAGEGQH